MTDVLSRDTENLHRALDAQGDEIDLRLSRETTEWFASLADARARGQRVVVTHGRAEVTPAEAASLLAISRPQVRKLMDDGKLVSRMVGTHHRISLDSIEAYIAWERERMENGMEELSRLQNELGLVD